MIKKILPILLALVGLGAGIGGGLMLRPAPEVVAINPCGDGEVLVKDHPPEEDAAEETDPKVEFVKLNNQFVIPDIEGGRVAAMVVLSLSLEVNIGSREGVYAVEPKLRDAFLQVLFDHANAGGFQGAFTDSGTMSNLRNALLEVAKKSAGDFVSDVLIVDIVRQDV